MKIILSLVTAGKRTDSACSGFKYYSFELFSQSMFGFPVIKTQENRVFSDGLDCSCKKAISQLLNRRSNTYILYGLDLDFRT